MKYELRSVADCSLKSGVFARCYEIAGMVGENEKLPILVACWEFQPLSSPHVDEEYLRNGQRGSETSSMEICPFSLLWFCLPVSH